MSDRVAALDRSALRPLLLTPPDGFVAARNAQAKQLKQSGRREDAAEVAALRRPSWIDWALNVAADADPEMAQGFADAAAAMRDAQREAVAGRGAGVAAALRDVRTRTADLARRADRVLSEQGRGSELAALVERLTVVAAGAAATSHLRDAVLLDGDEAIVDDDLAGDEPAAPPKRPATTKANTGTKASKASTSTTAKATPRAQDARSDADRAAERRELMRAVADRERAQRTADHHVARAEHTLAEAETKRDLAAAAVARAQDELDRATERAASAARTVAALRDAAAEEASALDALRARLGSLST